MVIYLDSTLIMHLIVTLTQGQRSKFKVKVDIGWTYAHMYIWRYWLRLCHTEKNNLITNLTNGFEIINTFCIFSYANLCTLIFPLLLRLLVFLLLPKAKSFQERNHCFQRKGIWKGWSGVWQTPGRSTKQ